MEVRIYYETEYQTKHFVITKNHSDRQNKYQLRLHQDIQKRPCCSIIGHLETDIDRGATDGDDTMLRIAVSVSFSYTIFLELTKLLF